MPEQPASNETPPPRKPEDVPSESLESELAALEAMLPPADDSEETAEAPDTNNPEAEPSPAKKPPRHPT